MDEEEWEVIPHKILADLRDEVHILKEKISQPGVRKDMVEAMTELKQSIDQMHGIFKIALETTQKDDSGEILARLSSIEKQNEQIAKALVTVLEFVEGKKDNELAQVSNEPMRAPLPPMPMSMPPPLRPPRSLPRAPSGMPSMPPPPAPPKKGLFGLGKR